MNDTSISDNVDVEEIMKKIKENVDKKRAFTGEITPATSMFHEDTRSESVDLAYIQNNWDIRNNDYQIKSHRNLVGPVLIKSREMVNGEVRRYVDPHILKQNAFNLHVVGAIESSNNRNIDQINVIKQKMDAKIDLMKGEIKDYTYVRLKEMISSINQDINNKAWLINMLENRLEKPYSTASPTHNMKNGDGINYFLFEEQFRGSMQEIKDRQSVFVHFFKDCKNVLDVGCGRGEFLELMKENGVNAHGIDINDEMIEFGMSKGLNVDKIDAITYLKSIKDESLDGIFIDQVVEHLEPEYLVQMLKLCHEKLMPGSHIFIETVNPLSLTSFVNFYIDMTHKKPVHPETLKFLVSMAGFSEINVGYSSPVRDDIKLKKIDVDLCASEKEKHAFEIYNGNIDRLNDMLFGAQDYSISGKK